MRDPGDGVHQDDLPEGRTATGLLLKVDRAGHVHERQADELGEAARLLLECSGAKEVMNPVLGRSIDPNMIVTLLPRPTEWAMR